MVTNAATLEMAKADFDNARDRVILDAIGESPESMWELKNAVAALGYYEDRLARIDDQRTEANLPRVQRIGARIWAIG